MTFIDEWRRKFPSCMVVKRLINIKIEEDTTILILYISYTHILGAKNCKNNFSTVAVININWFPILLRSLSPVCVFYFSFGCWGTQLVPTQNCERFYRMVICNNRFIRISNISSTFSHPQLVFCWAVKNVVHMSDQQGFNQPSLMITVLNANLG